MKAAVHQKPLNLRVSEGFHAEVVAAAAAESMSIAEFVRSAVRRAINPDRHQVHVHVCPERPRSARRDPGRDQRSPQARDQGLSLPTHHTMPIGEQAFNLASHKDTRP